MDKTLEKCLNTKVAHELSKECRDTLPPTLWSPQETGNCIYGYTYGVLTGTKSKCAQRKNKLGITTSANALGLSMYRADLSR